MDLILDRREDQNEDRDIVLATNSRASKSSAILYLLDNDNDHDNLMGGIGNHEDEEDILCVLSKPVEVVTAKKVFLFLLPHHCFSIYLFSLAKRWT